MHVFTDGSLKRLAYVFVGEHGKIGQGIIALSDKPTVNEAEYQAVIAALLAAEALGTREIELYSDSQLMIRQLQGTYVTNNLRLQALRNKVLALAEKFEQVEWYWLPREENLAGHLLEDK